MKKIFVSGVIMLSCAATSPIFGQQEEFSLIKEKRELKHEKREINTEQRGVRKEEKANRHPEVSYMTIEQFEKDFPDANNPVYSVGENFDEVSYLLNTQPFTAYYDQDSKLVGTITQKQMTDLPVRAQKIVNNNYIGQGYLVDKVLLFDDNEANTADMFIYSQQFNDEDIYFVELKKDGKTRVLQVSLKGNVSFFKNI